MNADAAENAGGEPIEPAVPTRRERRRLETRERLYEAAMHLLSERDFEAVTIEMITEAADVGKGTFFNYFRNKEAVVAYRFEKQLRLLTENLPPVSPDPAEVMQEADVRLLWPKLLMLTHQVAKEDARSRRLTRTLLSLALINPQVRAAHLNVRQRVCEIMEDLIRGGQRSGEFRSEFSAEDLTSYLVNVYFTILFAWSQSEDEETLAVIIESTFALAWKGMGNT